MLVLGNCRCLIQLRTRRRSLTSDVLRPPKLGKAKYAGETYHVILRCGYNGTEKGGATEIGLGKLELEKSG